ncbi:MAG: hypothetical protein ABSF29_10550 [Tepidisphaeraceae bacterium]
MDNPALETSKPARKYLDWLWPSLAFLPAIVPLIVILMYGVNMPFGDEWDIAGPLFLKASNGTLKLADIIAQHNEHRIAMTRLIMLAIGRLTHYNVKDQMVITWVVACAIAVLVYWISRKSLFAAEDRGRPWIYLLWFLANLMIFNLIQYENWLWGMQVHFFLPTFCLLAASLALLADLPRWVSFPIAILTCVISTYSAANGMLLWFILFPATRYAGRPASLIARDLWSACWVICAALTIWSYFHGYVKPAGHPSLLEALRHPIKFVLYFLVYLGSPLGPGTVISILPQCIAVGFVVFMLYASTIAYVWSRRHDPLLIKRALPWLALGAYVVTTDLVTDFARLGFGFDEAIASRYNTVSAMLYVALIYLIPLLCRDAIETYTAEDRRRPWALAACRLSPVLAGMMLALYAPCNAYALARCKDEHGLRANGAVALMFIDFFQDEALVNRTAGNVYQIPVVRQIADILQPLGYLHPPLVKTPDIKPLEAAEQRSLTTPGYYGYVDIVIPEPPGNFGISGWAVLPDHNAPADGVLLTYQIGDADPVVFGIGDGGQPSPSVVIVTGNPAYANAGFVKTFAAASIPRGDLKIQAWAFDLASGKAYALTNTKLIHNAP